MVTRMAAVPGKLAGLIGEVGPKGVKAMDGPMRPMKMVAVTDQEIDISGQSERSGATHATPSRTREPDGPVQVWELQYPVQGRRPSRVAATPTRYDSQEKEPGTSTLTTPEAQRPGQRASQFTAEGETSFHVRGPQERSVVSGEVSTVCRGVRGLGHAGSVRRLERFGRNERETSAPSLSIRGPSWSAAPRVRVLSPYGYRRIRSPAAGAFAFGLGEARQDRTHGSTDGREYQFMAGFARHLMRPCEARCPGPQRSHGAGSRLPPKTTAITPPDFCSSHQLSVPLRCRPRPFTVTISSVCSCFALVFVFLADDASEIRSPVSCKAEAVVGPSEIGPERLPYKQQALGQRAFRRTDDGGVRW